MVIDEDPPVKKLGWWKSGAFVFYPNTRFYRIWDFCKSILYMGSMYTIIFQAAFRFNSRDKINDTLFLYDYVVDAIQILDIIIIMFTAIDIREMSDYSKNYRKMFIQKQK